MAKPATSTHRSAAVQYLAYIVLPVVVLLALGTRVLWQQQQLIGAMTLDALRAEAEALVPRVESTVRREAEACLRAPEVSALATALSNPTDIRRTRLLFEKIRERRPFARHYFIVRDGAVRYPLVHGVAPRFTQETAMSQSEILEIRDQAVEKALAGYHRAFDLASSESARALAAARIARCLAKLGRDSEAKRAWRDIAARHPDQCDPAGRPFGLLAALELPEMQADAFKDLTTGRWEIGAEQLDYFVSRLNQPHRGTHFVEHLQLAAAFESAFHREASARPGEVYPYAFRANERAWQAFYSLAGSGPSEIILAVVADPVWIAGQVPAGFQFVPAGAAPDARTRVKFQTLFPHWELSLTPAVSREWEASTRARAAGAAVAACLIGFVLLGGVMLILRDSWRETALNRLHSEYVSGVSHDLKTPLTLVRLYAETLMNGDGFTARERRSYLRIIVEEGERLTRIVDKVLFFSGLEEKRRRFDFRPGDLVALAARTVNAYREHLERQGFQVDVELPDEPLAIRADPEAMTQAILNLLDNAVKYSGDSKWIGIRLRSRGQLAVFEVRDRGIGIAAEDREKLFGKFYRAANASALGGHGLGLYLVREIASAHGGSVEVESALGDGSCFRLVIPKSSEVQASD